MITAGMRSCVITLQFSLVVLLCVALSLAFEHSAGQVPGGGDLWAVAMVTPRYILPTLVCSLSALLSIVTYPPF